MLVLSRKAGEAVYVGNVLVKVVRVGGSVKLGFDGPRDVPINRAEVANRQADDEPAEMPTTPPESPATV